MENTKLKPYREVASCPKCGAGKREGDASVETTIAMEESMRIFPCACRARYCPGGKQAKEVQPSFSLGGITLSVDQRANVCAGIPGEHLHVTCSGCGYESLMECRDARTAP